MGDKTRLLLIYVNITKSTRWKSWKAGQFREGLSTNECVTSSPPVGGAKRNAAMPIEISWHLKFDLIFWVKVTPFWHFLISRAEGYHPTKNQLEAYTHRARTQYHIKQKRYTVSRLKFTPRTKNNRKSTCSPPKNLYKMGHGEFRAFDSPFGRDMARYCY